MAGRAPPGRSGKVVAQVWWRRPDVAYDVLAPLAGIVYGSYRNGNWALGTVDVDTGALRDLAVLGLGPGPRHEMAWSADGSSVAVPVDVTQGNTIVGGDIAIWDLARVQSARLPLGNVQVFATPVWSPDNAWVAFAKTGANGQVGGIDVVSPDGQIRREVSGSAGFQLVGWQPTN